MAKTLTASGAESLDHLIAKEAYYKAEQRGFIPGHEEEDWLAAEREIRTRVESDPSAKPATKARKATSRIRSAIGKISTPAKKKKA